MRWLYAMLALAATASGCRDAEPSTSGQPWVCDCQIAQQAESAEARTCAITAGQAATIAEQCLESAGVIGVRFCDCLPSAAQFCDIGDCLLPWL